MPRVRWLMAVPVLCVILQHALFGIVIVTADCWYDNDKHEEGVEVATTEPCLNCTCSRGALLCYLRICPKLPNPPPYGCILLHRYKSCCPELICSDIISGNGIEARSELDPLEMEDHRGANMGDACIINGSIYGPGSAMDSSSQCEYCYCLGGKQRCVKPKCLLPMDGCTPAYESNDCCPIHYNCTTDLFTSTTTTTLSPHEFESKGGCIVDSNFYPEGGKVLGIGHSICDNCYCLRGLVRCEPLSCAPPLLGCTPVIRPGECCAASYNCSGMIETQPEPYYGQFPTVSKDYAKLRKEVQHKRTSSKYSADLDSFGVSNTNVPFYVIAESSKSKSSTTKQYTQADANTPRPYYYPTTNSKPDASTKRQHTEALPEIYYVPTKVITSSSSKPAELEVMNYESNTLATTVRHKKYTSNIPLSEIETLDDTRIIRKINTQNKTNNNTDDSTTEVDSTTTDSSTTIQYTTEDITSTIQTTYETTTDITTTDSTTINTKYVTLKTILNSTDCSTKTDDVENRNIDNFDVETTTDESTTISSDITTNAIVTENKIKSKDAIATVHPKTPVENILNITDLKEHDYDYDYNAPTLPPSLPNLRIIPFVAADALDSKTTIKTSDFAQERIAESEFPFKNLFSPPVETEGGFVPKEPPQLGNLYENTYHTTNIGSNAVTSLPVPAITNPPKSNEDNCVVDEREVKHGESVSSEGTCAICVCFYGSLVCHEPQCPVPEKDCRNSDKIDRSTCCPYIICDEQIDKHSELTIKPQDTSTETPKVADPFVNVIRTEAPPDLKLLIGDMSNYLLKQTTLPPTTSTTTETIKNNTKEGPYIHSLDKLWQYLFADNLSETTKQPSTTAQPPNKPSLEIRTANHNLLETRENINDNLVRQPTDSNAQGVGILKLAGCNIYGRMYRVGRIIFELSGPCLQCKCTEIGVQCHTLQC